MNKKIYVISFAVIFGALFYGFRAFGGFEQGIHPFNPADPSQTFRNPGSLPYGAMKYKAFKGNKKRKELEYRSDSREYIGYCDDEVIEKHRSNFYKRRFSNRSCEYYEIDKHTRKVLTVFAVIYGIIIGIIVIALSLLCCRGSKELYWSDFYGH